MSFIKKLRSCVAFFPVFLASTSFAGSGYQHAVTILRHYVNINISNDERRIERTYTARIEREGAIDSFGNARIPFSPKIEWVDILEAYSVDRQGVKHYVPESAILVQSEATSASAPRFSDYKYKVVIFPKISVGSVIHLKYRIRLFKDRLPGYFAERYEIFPHLVYEDAQFTLTHPEPLFFHVEGRGMKGGIISRSNGKVTYRFTHRQLVAKESELASVDSADYAPMFSYSSYKSRIHWGWYYERLAAPKLEVTPEVKAIAEKETRGLASRREKIDALYRWVVKNIRYVSVIIDLSGMVPNHTTEILARGYGDCKDLTNLLWALLKAIDIDGSPALINMGDSFRLDGPATLAPFNHVILYVPSEDLYLDATATTVKPGVMYPEIAGKTVVLSTLGKMGRTPDINPETNKLSAKVDLEIDQKGIVKGKAIETAMGVSETRLRDWALGAQSASMNKNVRAILSSVNEQGTGSYVFGDPLDLRHSFAVTSQFDLEPTVNIPGPSGWKIPRGLVSSRIHEAAGLAIPPSRMTSFYCASGTYTERYTIRFPPNVKISAHPADTSYKGKYLSYSARYRKLKEGSYEVERVSIRNYGKSVCGLEEHADFREFQEAIKKDLRAQFVYF